MKILQINSVCGSGSTGRIAADLYKVLKEQSHDCVIAYGRKTAPDEFRNKTIRIGSDMDSYRHALLTRITDKAGFYSSKATKSFIKEAEEYNPDVIHLHNIHGYYINIEILFEYLKKADKPVVWTLHDCWAFTGHCAYFDYIGCDKWKTGCYGCPQKKEYPKSGIFDNSKWNYEQKKRLFTSVRNMTIITPSEWLAGLVKQSFLNKYPVQVINNGIDLNIFKPAESNFRENHKLEDKFIVLGVANAWEKRKGLRDFIGLSEMLNDRYKIVLVGLNGKQMENLPSNILGFTRTESIKELAEIYTAADVFVNPTLEENFPTVNLESLACGTPVITYKTGGSTESINEDCGIIAERGSINGLKEAIDKIKSGVCSFNKNCCTGRAKLYDKKERFGDYIEIYKSK